MEAYSTKHLTRTPQNCQVHQKKKKKKRKVREAAPLKRSLRRCNNGMQWGVLEQRAMVEKNQGNSSKGWAFRY